MMVADVLRLGGETVIMVANRLTTRKSTRQSLQEKRWVGGGVFVQT